MSNIKSQEDWEKMNQEIEKKPKTTVIMIDSDEAAHRVTGVEGWVDRFGMFYGSDENSARYRGCTHRPCEECGEPTVKMYTVCLQCRIKRDAERWAKREVREWDRETPLYSEALDEFVFGDLDEFMDDREIVEVENLRLVICDPEHLPQVGIDYFEDMIPEDGEVPDDVRDAMDALNKVIREQPPIAWMPGRYAVDVSEWLPPITIPAPSKEQK